MGIDFALQYAIEMYYKETGKKLSEQEASIIVKDNSNISEKLNSYIKKFEDKL